APGAVRVPDTSRPRTKNSVLSATNGQPCVEVPLVSLDDFRPRWGARRIGLLKIDVEGYESEVFAGARALLRKDRPRLIMFESLGGAVDEEIAAVLEDAAYTVFQLDEGGCPMFDRWAAQNLFAVPE